jgi:hypothetical protein
LFNPDDYPDGKPPREDDVLIYVDQQIFGVRG